MGKTDTKVSALTKAQLLIISFAKGMVLFAAVFWMLRALNLGFSKYLGMPLPPKLHEALYLSSYGGVFGYMLTNYRRSLNKLTQTPHVCFKVQFAPSGRTDDDLARLLERQLHTRFDSVRLIRTRFLTAWAFALQVGQGSFSMVLAEVNMRTTNGSY